MNAITLHLISFAMHVTDRIQPELRLLIKCPDVLETWCIAKRFKQCQVRKLKQACVFTTCSVWGTFGAMNEQRVLHIK